MRLNDSRLVTTFFTFLKRRPAGGRARPSSVAEPRTATLSAGSRPHGLARRSAHVDQLALTGEDRPRARALR
jgi:hypothetical protein